MSTTAPEQPGRSLPPHLTFLGFLAGAATAAVVYFGVEATHWFGFLTLCVVWYAVTVGIRDTLSHPHRAQWAVYIALVPVTAGVAAAVAYLTLDRAAVAALIALVAAPVVQWIVAHLFLRDVIEDKQHALRRAAGVE